MGRLRNTHMSHIVAEVVQYNRSNHVYYYYHLVQYRSVHNHARNGIN